MAKLKAFLEKYDTILFDMDGVITSEQAYWTTAALTVYEMLHSDAQFGTQSVCRAEIYEKRGEIRRAVFLDDAVISLLKNKGVNSNWDLAYVTLCGALIAGGHDFEKAFAYLSTLGENVLYEYDAIAQKMCDATGRSFEVCRRGGPLWNQIVALFQQYYLGTGDCPGLIASEEPLFPLAQTHRVLSALKAGGKTLGVGTGRPRPEIIAPLTRWGLLELFDSERIVTYDEVQAAERKVDGVALTKPHPYMFLKGTFGSTYADETLAHGDYDKERLAHVLVVGDAGADILAAHAAGEDFLAVLTGVAGQSARGYFESERAEHILDSICDMVEEDE